MSGPSPDSNADLLETILRRCAEAAPAPWYPKTYAETTGTPRDSLDRPLEQLRLAGLVRLTDWVQGLGQGYALTPEGANVLESPRLLGRLRDGKLSAPRSSPEAPLPFHPGTRLYQQRAQLRDEMDDPRPPVITRALLLANVLVFLAGFALAIHRGVPDRLYLTGGLFHAADIAVQEQIAYSQVLHETGSIRALDLVAGQWWRLLTYAFVHGGLIHLGMNMSGLYLLGPILERMWGRWRFLALYLTAALGGSCTAVIVRPFGPALVGASGALCGMLASVAVWVFLNRRLLEGEYVAAWRRSLAANFFLIVLVSLLPQVSWEGHLGGAVAGLIIAVPLNYHHFGIGWRRLLGLAGAAIVPLACLGAVIYVKNTGKEWEELSAAFRWQQMLQEIHDQRVKAERDEGDFQERVLAPSREAEKAALRVQLEAKGFLDEYAEPERRPEKKRNELLDRLAHTQALLAEARQAAAGAGPYETPPVEEQRQVVLQYLQEREKLCALVAHYLKDRRHFLADDNRAYEQQWRQVAELADRFRRIRP
ncbi:MAG TPA: rhomboid family intramembrane serine protease [Gemmataceae bacterium]|nr:rhomboid family intramembrane serine protease [Gemmataceae bacterium]